MPVQSALALEGLGAHGAGVRPVVGVGLLVHLQVGAVEERLRALLALERALVEVCTLVVYQEGIAL